MFKLDGVLGEARVVDEASGGEVAGGMSSVRPVGLRRFMSRERSSTNVAVPRVRPCIS